MYDMGLGVHLHKCVRHVYYPMRSNIRWQDFLACAVEFSTHMAHLFWIRPGLLLSKKPCVVAMSENLRDFNHHDMVQT